MDTQINPDHAYMHDPDIDEDGLCLHEDCDACQKEREVATRQSIMRPVRTDLGSYTGDVRLRDTYGEDCRRRHDEREAMFEDRLAILAHIKATHPYLPRVAEVMKERLIQDQRRQASLKSLSNTLRILKCMNEAEIGFIRYLESSFLSDENIGWSIDMRSPTR